MKYALILIAAATLTNIATADENKNTLNFFAQVNNEKAKTDTVSSEYNSPSNIELRYVREVLSVEMVNLSLGAYYSRGSEDGYTAKDQNVSYGGGPQVQMVKTDTKYEDKNYGLVAMVSSNIPLSNNSNWIFKPYAGLLIGLGDTKAEQNIKTDRKNPIVVPGLFSLTHNYYDLNSKNEYKQYNLLLGGAVVYNKFSANLEVGYRKRFSVKNSNNQQSAGDSEASFNQNDFQFANVVAKNMLVQMGIGYSF